MLIDGEKYACEACIRGHRVSNCNHYERPLQYVNRKGRPVSQCQHCRGLRKSRAAHGKCECGAKPHSKADLHPPSQAGKDQHGCCCSHGARCFCTIKKDHLEPRSTGQLNRSRSHTDSRKPRHLTSGASEAPLAAFINGHHQPMHRSNHAAHDRGMPYKIPRPHSIHGHYSFENNSTDSLPLLPSGTSVPVNYYLENHLASEERMVKSEHGSPALSPRVDPLNQLPQLDLSYGTINTDIANSPVPLEEFVGTPSYPSVEYLPSQDEPVHSASYPMPPVDWSAFDLQVDVNADSHAPSYASFEQGPTSHPGMTTSSSCDVSEAGDMMGNVHSPPAPIGSPFPVADQVTMSPYTPSVDAFPAMGTPTSVSSHPRTLNSPSFDPYNQQGGVSSGFYDELSMPEAQKLNHPGLASPPSAIRPTSDPLWANPYGQPEQVYSQTAAAI